MKAIAPIKERIRSVKADEEVVPGIGDFLYPAHAGTHGDSYYVGGKTHSSPLSMWSSTEQSASNILNGISELISIRSRD